MVRAVSDATLPTTRAPHCFNPFSPAFCHALAAEAKLAVVLGSEGDGLSDGTIAECDYTVRIPMSHGVDSLNVAAASAVAFWQLGRR